MANWTIEWNGSTMDKIEEEIKTAVNDKIGCIDSVPEVGNVLVFNSIDGINKKSWIAEAKSITTLLGSQGVTVATTTDEKKTLTLDANEITLNAGTEGTTTLSGNVYLGSIEVKDKPESDPVIEPAIEITSEKVAFSKHIDFTVKNIEVDKITRTPSSTNTDPLVISCSKGVQISDKLIVEEIEAPSSGSLTVNATTVEANNVKGKTFHYIDDKGASHSIDLTNSSFTTTDLTATNITAAGSFKVAVVKDGEITETYAASAGSYSADPQYRPIKIETTAPTTGIPGTLIAVLKPST